MCREFFFVCCESMFKGGSYGSPSFIFAFAHENQDAKIEI